MKPIRIHLLLAPLIVSATALSYPSLARAQLIDALAPQVCKYVKVGTPKVVLEHVQIIDGTGAEPSSDRNIYIEGGKPGYRHRCQACDGTDSLEIAAKT